MARERPAIMWEENHSHGVEWNFLLVRARKGEGEMGIERRGNNLSKNTEKYEGWSSC